MTNANDLESYPHYFDLEVQNPTIDDEPIYVQMLHKDLKYRSKSLHNTKYVIIRRPRPSRMPRRRSTLS